MQQLTIGLRRIVLVRRRCSGAAIGSGMMAPCSPPSTLSAALRPLTRPSGVDSACARRLGHLSDGPFSGLTLPQQREKLTQPGRCIENLLRFHFILPTNHQQKRFEHEVRMATQGDEKLTARCILRVEPVLTTRSLAPLRPTTVFTAAWVTLVRTAWSARAYIFIDESRVTTNLLRRYAAAHGAHGSATIRRAVIGRRIRWWPAYALAA